MEQSITSRPVQRLYLYGGSMVIIGGALAVPAVINLGHGASSIPLWAETIGGCAAAFGGVAEAVSRDPDEFATTRNGYWIGVLLISAGLSLASLLLRLIF